MLTNLESSWRELLNDQFNQPYFKQIEDKLSQDRSENRVIYPPDSKIFAALNYCPVNKVKAVIIGQDPYSNPGQAHGLCFSVPKGIKEPPSLKNIFKELKNDLGISSPQHGNLECWARQGILLLNAILTFCADENKKNSHCSIWEQFTNTIIQRLSATCENLVFLLWGCPAIKKQSLIDPNRGHFILTASHPSPKSAYRNLSGCKHFSKVNKFSGCKHFSKANEFLISKGIIPIDWNIY